MSIRRLCGLGKGDVKVPTVNVEKAGPELEKGEERGMCESRKGTSGLLVEEDEEKERNKGKERGQEGRKSW